jgi:hypothetical protein
VRLRAAKPGESGAKWPGKRHPFHPIRPTQTTMTPELPMLDTCSDLP